MISPLCPVWAPFLGSLGIAIATSLCLLGSAYGTAKTGKSLMVTGLLKPNFSMKNITSVAMAGIVGMYGVIVAVVMMQDVKQNNYSLYTGCMHLASGISTGLSGISCGFAIGIVGDAGVRASIQQPKLFIPFMLILIFAEILGLYGPIVSFLLIFKAGTSVC